jgi:hypothetical protein
LWSSFADDQCSVSDCKESVQLLKDMIDGNINSLKHTMSKTWKYAIILCDAVLLALSSEYSEAFNCCMRVHDSLQKAQGTEEWHLRSLSSCNAVYCLWHFQILFKTQESQNTTIALSEMLNVDVKSTARMGATSDFVAICMFHNLAHINIQSGEYLRAFSAWEEVHKALETMSQLKSESVHDTLELLSSHNSKVGKASIASIQDSISKWLLIKDVVSSSEYRCILSTT